jgi:hypothetical protein
LAAKKHGFNNIEEMKDLNKKAFGGLLRLLISLAVLLFLPTWTFDYWQAWIFLAAYPSRWAHGGDC